MQKQSVIANPPANQRQAVYQKKHQAETPFFTPFIQPKLTINPPNNIYEQEADAMADKVMQAPDAMPQKETFFKPAPAPVQRKCAHCEEEEKQLQRKDNGDTSSLDTSSTEHYLNTLSGGNPLDKKEQFFFGQQMGYDFSNVHIHNDNNAHQSAQSIGAKAYTSGSNIVFAKGEYQPYTNDGKKLLAHELTHVAQQSTSLSPKRIQRQNTSASAESVAVMNTLSQPGLDIIPPDIQHAQYGNVGALPGSGGFAGDRIPRLNTIIGEGITLNQLASWLLPLWTGAAPDATPGTGVLSTPPTVAELAQALLMYNFNYYGGTAMTHWRAGLRVPLPVVVDEASHTAIVNTSFIQMLASGFDPVNTALLDQASSPAGVPVIATTQAESDAERQRAQTFAATYSDAATRGIQLLMQARRNTFVTRDVFHGLFRVLSATELFETGLAFADNAVNSDFNLIASQPGGTDIIFFLDDCITMQAPAVLTDEQRQRVDRATRMIALVNTAHPSSAPAMPLPETTCANGVREVSVDFVQLHGSVMNMQNQLAVANRLFEHCCVKFTAGTVNTADEATTIQWIGSDLILRSNDSCTSPSAEERRMRSGALATFNLPSHVKAFFVHDLVGINAVGYSFPHFCGSTTFLNTVVVADDGDNRTLAHELGHLFTDALHVRDTANLMESHASGESLTPNQCSRIFVRAQ